MPGLLTLNCGQIEIFIQPGLSLRPPLCHTDPVVMFGLGVGIAPLRAILQTRAAEKKAGGTLGHAILYYCVRLKGVDDVFADEFRHFIEVG